VYFRYIRDWELECSLDVSGIGPRSSWTGCALSFDPQPLFSPLVYPERIQRGGTNHCPLSTTHFLSRQFLPGRPSFYWEDQWPNYSSHNYPRINTCKSVSKQTTLTSFRMNTYEKYRGGGFLLLTRNPRRISSRGSTATEGPLLAFDEARILRPGDGNSRPACPERSRGERPAGVEGSLFRSWA